MNADVALAILIGAVVGAAYLAALGFAVVQILRTGGMTPAERTMWIVGFLVAPIVAAIVWFAAGPHPFGLRFGTPSLR